MATFSVYHVPNPTFTLEPYAGHFTLIAVGERFTNDGEICNVAYEMTNSIEAPWYNRAAFNGLRKVVETRSTSIGDLVEIEDNDGRRFYRCAPMGWERVDARSSHVGGVARLIVDSAETA